MKASELTIALFVVGIVFLVIIPVPPLVMDFLLIFNITLSIIILLTTMYVKDSLDFYVFPSILLVTTLIRLALNISSTRLILTHAYAGGVIQAFGSFVIGGNPVVGFIIFLIIAIVQFIVITKGAERVSEVAARFTLDAMPGKQMAIDADLNAGLITEREALERRKQIQQEAKFYGAMDGASKFVRGDAIVSIIVIIINIVGGFIIGMAMKGMDANTALHTYTLLTVGEGLVNQIPALLISTATGIIVTRASSEFNLGEDIVRQIFSEPRILKMASLLLFALVLVPLLPKLPLILMGSLFAYLGFATTKRVEIKEEEQEESIRELESIRDPKKVYELLQIDPIELEFGYELIPLASGELLDRIVMIRRQIALELGIVVPMIRLRDNIQLKPNEYVIKIKGNEIARGKVYVDRYMAMTAGEIEEDVEGIREREPAFGLPAIWVDENERSKVEARGYTVVDVPTVIATHLTHIIKQHAHELLGRQEVQNLIDNIKSTHPTLVEELIPKIMTVGEVQKVLSNLLREGIPIRDLVTILETLADYAPIAKDTDVLTEYVRQALARTISNRYASGGRIEVITLDPAVEQIISSSITQTEHGSYLAIEPSTAQRILRNIQEVSKNVSLRGIQPVILTAPVTRFYLRKLVEQISPDIVVLSYNELLPNIEVISVGTVKLGEN
ncbi:flagellar biosynthesis protein FlhA [Caldanaerobacter subterraneus subsp. tengcongensis MB4]|uniref:Flagellar biosynthesis protein FlhA n=1 Tax=Caldanaerobacter subterraneus subsp. tengcongensis (strain DSM 15242 / JCM 11007 / NBRC 100824 / MB4) TaxID=273068 RepID=Q8RA08_CALS4|nr:flagellar biosynthesis protein FlhA [Caldanaerobacter subterraneus]AAM24644.1 Flagellar biosynthesis/type III secretory pathway protein [Caldanaerobacter subterraneus subsp. tengcongensis MB4]MCS3915794.1 flagellar biosynthesis protein FlhA [Caldanaerobacter subterraneus subsp. tengcongensis MB4]